MVTRWKGKIWSRRVILKYTLLQFPALAALVIGLMMVRKWAYLPAWIAWAVIAFWVAKDVDLFPFVWRSYDTRSSGDSFSMRSKGGIAEERIDPTGYARIHGELWMVMVTDGDLPIEKGEALKVVDIKGLTLIVKADEKEVGM
ncbi:MAG: NfeD family protein [Deltaproteobacteria bacterium]|nr:NfeD family protein [Deltaproteobacteria bacterium]